MQEVQNVKRLHKYSGTNIWMHYTCTSAHLYSIECSFFWMHSQPNFICFGSHVFPGSRYNEIFMWRTWHTLVAVNSKWFTLDVYSKRRFFFYFIWLKLRIAHGSHVFCRIKTKNLFAWPHRSLYQKIGSNRSFAHSRLDSKIMFLSRISLNLIENLKIQKFIVKLYNINILNNWKKNVHYFHWIMYERGTFSQSKREITLEKSTILESKSEMCKWSFWPLAFRF